MKRMNRLTGLAKALLAIVLGATIALGMGTAAGAASTVTVSGVASCDNGQAIVGIWMNSSGGGAGWVTDRPSMPGRANIAVFHKTFTANLPTRVSFDVGCGGTPAKWTSSNKSPVVTVSSATFTSNLWCNGNGVCRTAKAPANTGSSTVNPAAGVCWCTYRAAEFWKKMTGRYPAWGGDAGYWDDRAPTLGWEVSSEPRPRSLFVDQPANGGVGHVGYVSDVRIVNGTLQIQISDRNGNGSCRDGSQPVSDRTNVWINVKAGSRYIVAP